MIENIFKHPVIRLVSLVLLLSLMACVCPIFTEISTYLSNIPTVPAIKTTGVAPTLTPGGDGSRTPAPATPPAVTPYPLPNYLLDFNSTITTTLGLEHIRAQVLLEPDPSTGIFSGQAPVEVLQSAGDSTGAACTDQKLVEKPGLFQVVSAQLVFTPGSDSKELKSVVVVYSLDPQIVCTVDNTFGPSNWNLFWGVYQGHFTHTKDILDDSGPIPLITSQDWKVNGASAQKIYSWRDSVTGVSEYTKVDLAPANP